ncbi:MAG: phosphate signaling complex protein PhoU [Thermomicrobiales bacterium]
MRTTFQQQLATLRGDVLTLGVAAVEAVERAVGALQEDDREAAQALVAGDQALDERHAAIQQLAMTCLATQQPTARDLRAVTAALAIGGELERIGDYASGIATLQLRAVSEPALPPSRNLYLMARLAVAMLRRSLDAYTLADGSLARQIWDEDTAVDTYQRTLYQELLISMLENPSTLTRATHLLWIVHDLERVADRATNICEQTIFMTDGHWPDLRRAPGKTADN